MTDIKRDPHNRRQYNVTPQWIIRSINRNWEKITGVKWNDPKTTYFCLTNRVISKVFWKRTCFINLLLHIENRFSWMQRTLGALSSWNCLVACTWKKNKFGQTSCPTNHQHPKQRYLPSSGRLRNGSSRRPTFPERNTNPWPHPLSAPCGYPAANLGNVGKWCLRCRIASIAPKYANSRQKFDSTVSSLSVYSQMWRGLWTVLRTTFPCFLPNSAGIRGHLLAGQEWARGSAWTICCRSNVAWLSARFLIGSPTGSFVLHRLYIHLKAKQFETIAKGNLIQKSTIVKQNKFKKVATYIQ